jgi:hypothetical protein
MKTMLALALVGLLSITSLAEEKKFEEQEGSEPLPQATKRPSVQPLTKDEPDELSQKSCPSGFKRIEDKDTGNFCISEGLLSNYSYANAIQTCNRMEKYSKGDLCSNSQLVSACSKKENFVRNIDKIGMWTFGKRREFLLEIGGTGCETKQISIDPLDMNIQRYRCCIKL